MLAEATPEKLAAVERFLCEGKAENGNAESRNGTYASPNSFAGAEGEPARFVFRRSGRRHWEVILGGGRAFRLRNNLGARYLNYLLHEPNEPIRAFDLEVAVQLEKGEARAGNSFQPENDPQAMREYRQELRKLQAERVEAQALGRPEELSGLNGQIAALESALRESAGAADTGERARDNVRKAVAVVTESLREGGPEEKAFAEHLRQHLSIGHDSQYSQPEGRIWK